MAVQTGLRKQVPYKRKSGGWLLFLVLLLLLVAGATLAGWLLFNQSSSDASLKLTLEIPDHLTSGQLAKLKVNYVNQDKVGADNLELALTYPDGFYFSTSSLPTQAGSQNVWELPALTAGQSGELEISGQIVGKVNDTKKWQARLSYHPANFNSPFVSEASIDSLIGGAILEGTVVAPGNVLANQPVILNLTTRNATLNQLNKLKVFWELPPAWKITASQPSTTAPNLWLVDQLDPQATQQFQLTTDKVSPGSYNWRVTVSQINDDQTQTVLYQDQGTVTVVAGQLQTSLNLVKPAQPVVLGSQLELTFNINNPTPVSLGPLNTNLTFDGSVVDWDKWSPPDGWVRQDNVLAWTLPTLDANQSATQTIVLPLLKQATDSVLNISGKTGYLAGDQQAQVDLTPLAITIKQ